jgi:TadE-like protein
VIRLMLTLRRRPEASRGQSLVEMTLIIPVLLLIVLGTLEFGFVFDHHLTLEYATREGARTGAALVNGGGPLGCGGGQSPNAATVDPQIIAAVQRVVKSPGSPVVMSRISAIRIYKSDANGQISGGLVNTWIYQAGAGPTVDGAPLDFIPQTVIWQACSRTNGGTPDSIGVGLSYTYNSQTALISFIPGLNTIPMNDRTVMQMNPTDNT